jgi:tRNA(Ile)-lysidine synthase
VTDFPQRVSSSIQNRRLFKHGEKILVAVSGGLDSMALLHALKNLSAKHKWKIAIAHFNHQLRERSSDADETLVRKTAAAMKLPVAVERAYVKQFARKSKLSIEMAARKLRHEFFARVARERKIKIIALAHHADDQVELFFLRLLRGAGGEGLMGMKTRSPSPADKRISLIRPLLDFSKAELAEFARKNKIRFRNDATNLSSDFVRNRIRNELLPLLRKKYQPALDKVVLRLMEIVGAESDFIGEAAQSWLARRKPDFGKLPVALQRRVLKSQLVELGVAADFDLIESLRKSPNYFVSVGLKISALRDAQCRVILRAEQISKFKENKLVVKLGRAGEAIFAGVKFDWRIEGRTISPTRIGSRKHSLHQMQKEFFDADKIGGKIILRHWHAGDRFQPIGLKSAAKLQDLFTNQKIPHEQRRNLILATTASGEIFWVEGLRISENFKLTPETKWLLVWHWNKRG